MRNKKNRNNSNNSNNKNSTVAIEMKENQNLKTTMKTKNTIKRNNDNNN